MARSKVLLASCFVLVAAMAPSVFAATHDVGPQASPRVGSQPAGRTLRERFDYLSHQNSNRCALRSKGLAAISGHDRLQGACCTPMAYGHYVDQIRGLRQYSGVAAIPPDPYDIRVSLAHTLVSYDRHIVLTGAQKRRYKQAMKIGHEHGPCCCHCWRWTAFRGQAKFLMSRRHYGPAQIARVWDLEDGCGS